MDARHRYMATIVEDSFGASSGMVDAVIGDNMALMNNFLSANGPRTVYFTYQPELREGPGGELVPFGGKLLTVKDTLSVLVDDAAKAVYFVRVAKDDVGAKAPEQDICSGEVNREGLECFQCTLQVQLRAHPVPLRRCARPDPTLCVRACAGAVRPSARKHDAQDVGGGKEAGR